MQDINRKELGYLRKFYWKNREKTRMLKTSEKTNMLNDETIIRINSAKEELAKEEHQRMMSEQSNELKDWQKEIMLRNEQEKKAE